MSPYLLLYAYIAVFACISWRLKKNVVNLIFFVTLLILFLFLSLRYGQGTDYFGYELLFNYWKNISDMEEFLTELNYIHGEYLWNSLGYLFNKIKLNFQHFICVWAIVGIYGLYRYINRYCRENKMWAVLLAFPTLYLTYMFSGLRQSVVICTFIGIMLPWLENKKLFRYYLCACVMILIHSSAVSLCIIPIITKLSVRTLSIGVWLSLFIGISLNSLLSQIAPHMPIRNLLARMGEYNIFFPAVAERIFMFIFVSTLYYKKCLLNSKTVVLFYKIYIYSVMLYLLFISYSLVASRLSIAPRMVEIALIVRFMDKLPKTRGVICAVILTLNILIYCKNINSYIWQGEYQNVNILNYPYINIYNKDIIHKYRQITVL